MSLGLFPSPPTDNLYKFVAVAGLLLFIGAPVYWATFYLQLAEKENAAQVAKTELANQILKYGTLPAPPKRGEQPSPGFTEALATQQELIETRRREARLAEAQEALFQRLSRVVGTLRSPRPFSGRASEPSASVGGTRAFSVRRINFSFGKPARQRMAPPNQRLQRTPSASPPSPLSRKTLDGESYTVAVVPHERRSACLAICLLFVAALAHAADAVPFPPARCGISFQPSDDWTVRVSYPKGLVCRIVLSPPDDQYFVSTSPGTPADPCYFGDISIRVVASSLESIAAKNGFSRVEGVWRYEVGTVFDNGRAEALAGQGWRGYRGATTSHVCGAAQTMYVVILGRRTRALDIGVADEKLSVLDAILRTLRVEP